MIIMAIIMDKRIKAVAVGPMLRDSQAMRTRGIRRTDPRTTCRGCWSEGPNP
jgi:hypothetical protein